MKVTLESTTKVVTLGGVECRLWQGTTERGVPCHAFIPRIAVAIGQDSSEFDADLLRRVTPRDDLKAIPLRMLL